MCLPEQCLSQRSGFPIPLGKSQTLYQFRRKLHDRTLRAFNPTLRHFTTAPPVIHKDFLIIPKLGFWSPEHAKANSLIHSLSENSQLDPILAAVFAQVCKFPELRKLAPFFAILCAEIVISRPYLLEGAPHLLSLPLKQDSQGEAFA